MKTIQAPPSPEAGRILQALRKAVREKLDEKRRLGHYYVVWEDDHVVFIGDDVPTAGGLADEQDKPARQQTRA